MSKSRQTKEAESQEKLAQEQRTQAGLQRTAAQAAEQRITQAGATARTQMGEAARPSTEETGRLERYREAATTPGETLMTQTGPIAQAVARRVQERVTTPGMDLDMGALEQTVGTPIWASLKRRGITPPAGGGAGLAGQQYFQQTAPYMAGMRQAAISEDIGRGQQYGTEARGLQMSYEDLERGLADLLSSRRYEAGMGGAQAQQLGVREGAPYGPRGAQDYAAGMVGAAGTEAQYAGQRAQEQKAKRAAEGEMARMAAELALIVATAGTAAPAVAAGRMAKPGGGGKITAPSLKMQEETPYSRALAQRAGRY